MAESTDYAGCGSASRRRLATFSPAPGNSSRSPVLGTAPTKRSAPPPIDRARIEALIEHLIALLDARDAPQADMEPDHDGEEEADWCLAGDDRGTIQQFGGVLARGTGA